MPAPAVHPPPPTVPWARVLLACLGCAITPAAGSAQQRQGLAPGPWPLEAIELADGRRLEGLLIAPENVAGTPAQGTGDVEFLQIVRPAGRPMHLVSWPPFPAPSVRFVERLPTAERTTLRHRVEAFRRERRRGDEDAVRLVRLREDGPWLFDGPAFSLESTADPTVSRAAVVQLQLTFDALESLVPPVAPTTPVTVRLCGSLAEYRAVQEELGLRLDNPAFYVSGRRLLVAGSELPTLLSQQRAADDVLDAARQRHLEHGSLLDERLRGLAASLEAAGVPRGERAEIVTRARIRANREQTEEIARIEGARRANAVIVEQARRRFLERLAHEAWHAYADCRLRATRPAGAAAATGLPTWLDEGLAQVVETAILEGGELRLEAPDPTRTARLREVILAGRLPPVADLVSADEAAFVGGHDGTQGLAYLAAWALAFDVAVVRPLLTPDKIRELAAASEADPVAALEALVGMPVDRYDRQWRQRVLGLRSQPVSGER